MSKLTEQEFERLMSDWASGSLPRDPAGSHPEIEDLIQFVEEGRQSDFSNALNGHLQECPECWRLVADIEVYFESASGIGSENKNREAQRSGHQQSAWTEKHERPATKPEGTNPLSNTSSPREVSGSWIRSKWGPMLLAAAFLGLVGLGFLHQTKSRGHGLHRASTSEDTLVKGPEFLAQEYPDLFRNFRGLSRDERLLDLPEAVVRSERPVFPLFPLGVVSSDVLKKDTLDFRWMSDPLVDSFHVKLFYRGEEIWSRDTSEATISAPMAELNLKTGVEYSWELSYENTLAGFQKNSGLMFQIADPQESVRLEEAFREIQNLDVGPNRFLLKAHFAFRMGRMEEAREATVEFLANKPNDRIGWESLLRIYEELGHTGTGVMRDRLKKNPKGQILAEDLLQIYKSVDPMGATQLRIAMDL